jgi:hypothetical protein
MLIIILEAGNEVGQEVNAEKTQFMSCQQTAGQNYYYYVKVTNKIPWNRKQSSNYMRMTATGKQYIHEIKRALVVYQLSMLKQIQRPGCI